MEMKNYGLNRRKNPWRNRLTDGKIPYVKFGMKASWIDAMTLIKST